MAHGIDVRNSECEVRVRTVNLDLEPRLLLARIDSLASEVAA